MRSQSKFYLLTGFLYFVFLFFSACKNFYKPTKVSSDKATIEKMQLNNRYFILRSGERFFHMTNISISPDNKTISSVLEPVSSDHLLYINNPERKYRDYNRDTSANELPVLNEVHLYLEQDSAISMGSFTFQLDKLSRIELIEKDRQRTTNNRIAVGTVVTLGALIVALVIVAATKSSCPFVSAFDGNEFRLQGEIFGGAILPSLERNDYLPLQMAMMPDSSLQVKISNELKEHQFTNLAELWVVDHPKGTSVLPDENGNLYAVSKPLAPVWVNLNQKNSGDNQLSQIGDGKVIYMDDTSSANAVNELTLQFKNPRMEQNGKLILNLRNSYFLDLLYGEMAKGFGTYYPTYIRKQSGKPATATHKWVSEQRIPLTVEVRHGSDWVKVEELATVGPLANRLIAIDLGQLTYSPVTEIRLSSGFMFWEIDYAAIEYENSSRFKVNKLKPVEVTDEKGNEVTSHLTGDDDKYLSQPQIGNSATLKYKTVPLNDPALQRSYILHAKGYYMHLRDFKNKPNLSFLRQFKSPGAFPLFGMAYYKKFSKEQFKTTVLRN